MKIGILTFHSAINNGAVIQAFSLSSRIKDFLKSGDTVEIINYQMPVLDDYYKTSLSKHLAGSNPVIALKKIYRLLGNPNRFRQDKERFNIFRNSLNKLDLSETLIQSNDTEELFSFIENEYDIVVAGSDAIWNYDLWGWPNPYFLSKDLNVCKMSYAASVFGMNYELINKKDANIIADTLNSYSFLGVRDDESINFAKKIGVTKQLVHTCDPTVFLDLSKLPINPDELITKLKAKGFDFNKTSIAVMGSDALCEMIRRMFGNEYQVVSLFNYCVKADINLYDLSPFEWAYVFRYFSVTFTTFFHGTLLSLKNNTPVICFALNSSYADKHTTKVEDLLNRINLSDCYFQSDYRDQNYNEIKEHALKILNKEINYNLPEKMEHESKSSDVFFDALGIELGYHT